LLFSLLFQLNARQIVLRIQSLSSKSGISIGGKDMQEWAYNGNLEASVSVNDLWEYSISPVK
jgi:hypothetical protein